ncbi:MAG: hypothetical protein ACOCZ6_01985 [Nanoarchaeota archaeon]
MNNMIVFPIFAVICLTFAMQLLDIAESTSEKALGFTEEMNNAVDCATRGVDMRECSPGLYDYEFEEEMEKTLDTNLEFAEKIKEKTNSTEEIRIIIDGEEFIIEE